VTEHGKDPLTGVRDTFQRGRRLAARAGRDQLTVTVIFIDEWIVQTYLKDPVFENVLVNV
jgi:hypothetical protein